MGYYTDALKEILYKSLDLKYWLYVGLAMLLMFLAMGATVLVFLFPFFISFASLGFSATGIMVYLVLGILFLLVFLFVSTYFEGLLLNLGKNFLDRSELSFDKAFDSTTERIKDAFKVQLIVSIVFGALVLVLMLPFIFTLFGAVNAAGSVFSEMASNPASFLQQFVQQKDSKVPVFLQPLMPFILKAALWLFFGLIVIGIIYLVLLPFFLLIKQVPFFEKRNAVDSIKRTIHYAKKNYVRNWLFFLLFMVFFFVVQLAYIFAQALLEFPLKMGLNVLFQAVFGLILLLLVVIFTIWATAFSTLFSVKIYEMNALTSKKPLNAEKEVFDERKGKPAVQPWQKIKPQV